MSKHSRPREWWIIKRNVQVWRPGKMIIMTWPGCLLSPVTSSPPQGSHRQQKFLQFSALEFSDTFRLFPFNNVGGFNLTPRPYPLPPQLSPPPLPPCPAQNLDFIHKMNHTTFYRQLNIAGDLNDYHKICIKTWNWQPPAEHYWRQRLHILFLPFFFLLS